MGFAVGTRRKVEQGAKMLDKKAPNWYKVISLERLQLSSCELCICGQIGQAAVLKELKLTNFVKPYRSWDRYTSVIRWLGLDGVTEAPLFGFDIGKGTRSYNALDREWRRQIKMRLAADERDRPA